MTMKRDEFGVDLGSVTGGRLIFRKGTSDLRLSASDSPEELYRARFEGIVPEVRVEGGVITVEYPNVLNPLKWRKVSADIQLNPTIPWEIEIRGGASGIVADLVRLETKRFGVIGGVNNVRVDLSAPSDRVPFEITGGANDLTVRRPKGTAASLDLKGGAVNLTFDEQQFGAIGGKLSLKSAGYDDSDARYEVSVIGGANAASLTTA